MTASGEQSSLTLILAASTGILLCAGIGWFLLSDEPSETVEDDPVPISLALAIESIEAIAEPPTVDIDAELRKARLAADAGFLVAPPERNALHFYGRILAADPDNARARAETDAALARVSLEFTSYLAADDYPSAWRLTETAAGLIPEHVVIGTMRGTLSEYVSRRIADAIGFARAGDQAAAEASIASIESLPGVRLAEITAARASVAEIERLRVDEELALAELEREAEILAIAEWTERVRGAIKSDRLIAPVGESARDFLAEREGPKETVDLLTDEMTVALIDATYRLAEAGEYADAEAHVRAASDFGAGNSEIEDVRAELEQQIIEAESRKVIELSEFVRLNTEPARYPRMATMNNVTGWVDVEFMVTTAGTTSDIRVTAAEPANIFNESAIAAVEQWTFVPREFRGQLIDQRTTARLAFRLE